MRTICEERGGPVERVVRVVKDPEDLLSVVEGLSRVRSFLPSDGDLGFLLWPSTVVLGVDDVGAMLVLGIRKGEGAEVHVTFWDGRLRGREALCRELAELVMGRAELRTLWTRIPKALRAVLAFARRVGFEEIELLPDGRVLLALGRKAGEYGS